MSQTGSINRSVLSETSSLARYDLEIIVTMINDGSRVLDIGCGDGALLDYLGRNLSLIHI